MDRQRVQEKPWDGMASPFTFGEWCEKYRKFDDVKGKRSLAVEFRVIDLHLKPFSVRVY